MSVAHKLGIILVLGVAVAACSGDQVVQPELSLDPAEAAFAKGGAGKTAVCHRPPDNPSNVRLISISTNAVADHMAHGDHASFEGSCYVVESATTFAPAEQACVDQYGGHLASIHSQAEDDFISGLVDPNDAGGITAWIGGFAAGGFTAGPGGTYDWTDGSPWDYQNWRLTTGEPNATGAPAGVQFWPDNNGGLSGWNDVPQSANLGRAVCKYQP